MASRTSGIAVREAAGRRERRAFLRLPWRLYRSDPLWVPPLLSGIDRTLDPKRNPFFKHAESRLYVAWRDDRPVGRIAATVDHRHNEHRHEAMGFWGFFETENDPAVSRALFGRAAADLRERGMTEMQGPMNPSVNNQCGLLVDGFDHPPAILMPYNPPYYPAFAEQAGLEPLEDLYAYFIDPERLARDPKRTQRLERLATSIRRRHPELTVRSIDLAHFEVDIRALGSLMERALNELPGHVPMPEEEMLFMTRDMKSIVDPGLVLLADVAGRPVGCAFGLPDINPILKRVNGRLFPFGWARLLRGKRSIRGLRIFGWGALPAYRHMGVMPLLMAHLIRNARDRGYTKAELSWIRETNTRSFGTLEHAVAPRLYKRYRLYTSDL